MRIGGTEDCVVATYTLLTVPACTYYSTITLYGAARASAW